MKIALYPTIITPFTHENKIDYDSLDRLIEYLFFCGSDGLFAVCQSSEMFFLSEHEKLELAAFCIDRCRKSGKKCVVSGHTQEKPDEQLRYLKKLEQLKPDAIIFVSNRLAMETESDDVLINNIDWLIDRLDADTRFGIYECPYPYKRLLSESVMDYMVQSGRFDFVKDTCCDAQIIRRRLKQLSSSSVQLFNANAATLAQSLMDGAAGYSGVMLNFIPDVFGMLKQYISVNDVRTAQNIASMISVASVFEARHYPVNAKQLLVIKGLLKTTVTRSVKPDVMTGAQISELRELLNQAQRLLNRYKPCLPSVHIIPGLPPFRSCHASSVLPLDHGDVLAAYFAGDREGADNVGIWLSRYTQGTWHPPVCIAKVADRPHWNPVLFASEQPVHNVQTVHSEQISHKAHTEQPVHKAHTERTVHLYFKVGSTVSGWKSWFMSSHDQGNNWSQPSALTEDNPAGGPVRSKPLRLSNNWVLAPNSDETDDMWSPRIDCSKDGGYTFQKLADIPLNRNESRRTDYMSGKGAIQPTLWESSPGKVHALLRTTEGVIFRSDSADYGRTWCQAYPTSLPGNNSGIDVAFDGSRLFLVFNPISQNWGSRNPLVIYQSNDNGVSFFPFKTVENMEVDPEYLTDAEFSYPALVLKHNRLHLTYTYLRRQIAYCLIDLDS